MGNLQYTGVCMQLCCNLISIILAVACLLVGMATEDVQRNASHWAARVS